MNTLLAPQTPVSFTPARVTEIEVGNPLSELDLTNPLTGQLYAQASCLVRLHGAPIGMLSVSVDDATPERLAHLIWRTFGDQLRHHLSQDHLSLPITLTPAGLPTPEAPPCQQWRRAALSQDQLVSVVIPTRNRPELLRKCLQSLLAQSYPHFEIIIADNAPEDDRTHDLIVALNDPRVRYVREDHPGATWARNTGWRAAQGTIVAFTDDDVWLDGHWLAELVGGFTYAEGVGCVSGLILAMEQETPAQIWFEEYGGFGKGFTPRIFTRRRQQGDPFVHPFAPGRFGTGASMAFQRSFLERWGGFDPHLAHGMDIAILFDALMRTGKLVYWPNAILYHQHFREYEKLKHQMYRYGLGLSEFMTRTLFKYPHLAGALLLRAPFGVAFLLNPRSTKNYHKSADFPEELTTIEVRGFRQGFWSYLRNRRQVKRERRHRA